MRNFFGLKSSGLVEKYEECAFVIVSFLIFESGQQFKSGLNYPKHGKTLAVAVSTFLDHCHFVIKLPPVMKISETVLLLTDRRIRHSI